MGSIKQQIFKCLAVAILTSSLSLANEVNISACDELHYSNGKHSDITIVDSVEYQETTGTFFFITKGEEEFWVLDIKREPYTEKKMAYYTKLYVGKKVQVDFTVANDSITTMTYKLLVPVKTKLK